MRLGVDNIPARCQNCNKEYKKGKTFYILSVTSVEDHGHVPLNDTFTYDLCSKGCVREFLTKLPTRKQVKKVKGT